MVNRRDSPGSAALLAPSTVSVEVTYTGAAAEIVQLNGSTAVIHGRKGEAPCGIYRYRVDNDVKSGWQTITPPPEPEPEPEPEVPAA